MVVDLPEAAGPGRRPVISSKVQPPVRRRRVSRPRLLALCSGARRKLTVIRAPAGWGKSTLLAEWHATEAGSRRFAWLTLDRGDNDPVRFWSYLIEALRTQHPTAGATSLFSLESPRVDIVNDVLPQLSNELATSAHGIVLVLDDYHLITNPQIQESLAAFVDHLPRVLELALATRSMPALPLARLRARGELVEIDGADLSFSVEDADSLLNDLNGLGLEHDAVQRLQERTEGWAAGLYLASLTLRGRGHAFVEEFVREFAGDDRHVVDYLSAEVLSGQPAEVRAFLLRTSLLDRFCAPLCDAVTGGDDARRILRDMESSNFFLIPLDNRRVWYRYHHLFAELLRQELALAEPASVGDLHRRASAWHRDNGTPSAAIRHATAAGDVADAATLILDNWIPARDRARMQTILAWLAGLPADAVAADPRLALVKATTLQEIGRIDEADHWLEAAERAHVPPELRAGPDTVAAGIVACRAINQYFNGDAGGIRRTAAISLGHRGGTGYWHSALLTTLGTAQFVTGRVEEAALTLEQAIDSGVASDHALALAHALGWAAVVHVESGRPDRARGLVQQIDDARLTAHTGLTGYYGAAMPYIARGVLHHHDGRLGEADHELARGSELAHRGAARFEVVYGLVARARLTASLGDHDTATDMLREARLALARCHDPGRLADLLTRAERAARPTRGTGDPRSAEDLSDRELAVLRLLQTELTQREMAAQLFVSFNTVKTHVRSIFRKLDASTRTEAVRRGRALGLI
jgi:LuxR family maltose regulon positive regulatory protein